MRRWTSPSLMFVVAAAMLGLSAAPVAAQFGATVPANPFATQATPPPALPASPILGGGTPAAPWDPYALPGATTPQPALAPLGQPALGQPAQAPGLGYPFNDWLPPQTKLIQNVSLRNAWLNRGGSNGYGIDDVLISTSLAFPFFFNMNVAPIVFTPGFNFHFLQGPIAPPNRDIPATVYDAFGQFSWLPQFGPRLGADLAVSLGVYTDFSYVDSHSLRILGRGLGTWTFNPQWKAALGIVYLNRQNVKILPAGGLVWTPNADTRYEILFPQPKFSHRVTNWGTTEVWAYIGGEYGGGQWSITHADNTHDTFTYNDFRFYAGVETIGVRNFHGFFEVGWIFNREILFRSGVAGFNPSDTVMLRGGVSF